MIDIQHPLGKLTSDQVEMVQNSLMGAMHRQLEQYLASTGQAATFRGIKYTEEIIKITYKHEISK